jgi:hypothetical protein
MALREKMGSDEAGLPIDRSSSMGWEAEFAAHGGSMRKNYNEV